MQASLCFESKLLRVGAQDANILFQPTISAGAHQWFQRMNGPLFKTQFTTTECVSTRERQINALWSLENGLFLRISTKGEHI